jgi:hypothetical protein
MSTNERDEQVRAVLLGAAKLIEENGWCQGTLNEFADDHECFCLVGAISRSVGRLANGSVLILEYAVAAVCRHIGLELGDTFSRSASAWNDAPERTQAEVVAALRGAAEGLGK